MEAHLQFNYISIIFLLFDKQWEENHQKDLVRGQIIVFCSSQIMSLQQFWTSDWTWEACVGVLTVQHCLVTQVGGKARRLKRLTPYNMTL